MRSNGVVGPMLVAALALAVGASPAAAGGANKPKVKPASMNGVKANKVKAPKAASVKPNAVNAAPKAKPAKVKTAKVKTAKVNTAGINADAPKAKAPKAKASKSKGNFLVNGGSPNIGGPNTGGPNEGPVNGGPNPPAPPNKAQRHLEQNANLRNKLLARLPPNTDINAAASGFKNLGQFVAAVNVSHNHGIAFADLKALMTGDHPLSLGQALQQLRGLNPNAANQIADPALINAQREINPNSGINTTSGTNPN
ncbi:MAG TPA: hypothetical protein VF310_14770 [Vicinamibacteria bacterium]